MFRFVPERVRLCRRVLRRQVRTWGPRTHLLYFTAVMIESHGYYGIAAALCLALGVAAEWIGEEDA